MSNNKKIKLYGTRLIPINDIFNNLNQNYILNNKNNKIKLKDNKINSSLNYNSLTSSNSLKNNKNKKLNNLNNIKEIKELNSNHNISFIEQRDNLINELINLLKINIIELYDICEYLVMSSNEYTSLVFVVSDKLEVQISKDVIFYFNESLSNFSILIPHYNLNI